MKKLQQVVTHVIVKIDSHTFLFGKNTHFCGGIKSRGEEEGYKTKLGDLRLLRIVRRSQRYRLRSLLIYPEGSNARESILSRTLGWPSDRVTSENEWVVELLVHGHLIRFQKQYVCVSASRRRSSFPLRECRVCPVQAWRRATRSRVGRSEGSRIHELRQVRRLRNGGSFDKKHTDAQGEA